MAKTGRQDGPPCRLLTYLRHRQHFMLPERNRL
jgi:hypothetical protein